MQTPFVDFIVLSKDKINNEYTTLFFCIEEEKKQRHFQFKMYAYMSSNLFIGVFLFVFIVKIYAVSLEKIFLMLLMVSKESVSKEKEKKPFLMVVSLPQAVYVTSNST